MNHAAKNTRADKPADKASTSDIRELADVADLSDLDIEEIVADEVTGVRARIAMVSTPPPVPRIDKGLMAHMDAMEAERAQIEFDTFQKRTMKGYRFNAKLGIWERDPHLPKPKIRDERDIQGA